MARIRPNWPALNRALRGRGVQSAVKAAAEEIADNVREEGIRVQGVPGDIDIPVRVSTYETDRARATVWLAHPSGLAVQAKHGSLTRAASEAGLEVES